MLSNRRKGVAGVLALLLVVVLYQHWSTPTDSLYLPVSMARPDDGKFHWANVQQEYPVEALRPLPKSARSRIPKIQHNFPAESSEARAVRLQRLAAVKSNFTHAFSGYKTNSWLHDEVGPLTGHSLDPFGGWAASLVDSLGSMPSAPASTISLAYT